MSRPPRSRRKGAPRSPRPPAEPTLRAELAALGLLGFVTVGESPNDAVVPARSAHGRSKGGRTIGALRERIAKTPIRFFNHFEGGSASQPISAFADQDIFPILTDWTVSKLERFDVTNPQAPDQEGSVEAEVRVEFNVPHGDTTGMVLLVHRKDGNGTWRILDGADPDTLAPRGVVPIAGNSRGGDPLVLRAGGRLPVPNPVEPSTQTTDVRLLAFRVGKTTSTVPQEPTGNFGVLR